MAWEDDSRIKIKLICNDFFMSCVPNVLYSYEGIIRISTSSLLLNSFIVVERLA